MGHREEIEQFVRPNVEAWSNGARTLARIDKRYPQSAYARLVMLLKLE